MPASLNKYLANLQVDEEELPRYFSVTENDSCSHGKVTWFQACLMPVETSRGVSCPRKLGRAGGAPPSPRATAAVTISLRAVICECNKPLIGVLLKFVSKKQRRSMNASTCFICLVSCHTVRDVCDCLASVRRTRFYSFQVC